MFTASYTYLQTNIQVHVKLHVCVHLAPSMGFYVHTSSSNDAQYASPPGREMGGPDGGEMVACAPASISTLH